MSQSAPTAGLPAGLLRPAYVGPLLLVAVVLAWANSWSAPFVFDDIASIVENPTLRSLTSLAWLNPPHTAGETVSGRPLLNLSFALNYAISGPEVWSYHVLNWLIHAAAAFALWAVLRRLPTVGRGVALATALLWALHPLQTAAVTSVVQRAESLASLCTLLTLYGFVRYATDESRRTRWAALSVLACLAGMAVKETVAVAPVLVLLLDRGLFTPTWREIWRRRAPLYLALAATWVVLGVLVTLNHGRGGSAGLASSVDVVTYARTQVWAVVHYLRLVVWPVGQTFDYGMVVVDEGAKVIAPALLLLALALSTIVGLGRRHPVGVAGAGFFLLLAPSSSVVPIATQTIAEHRIYLALAVPLLLLSAGVARLWTTLRWPAALLPLPAVLGAGLLGLATHARNEVYRSPASLWADTVAQRPENPRAHYNLGLALLADGRRDEAIQEFQRAIALQPTHAYAQFQLGVQAMTSGNPAGAQPYFTAALAADPHYVDARVNLAHVLAQQGQAEAAVALYREALAEQPAADIRVNLAGQLIQLGRMDEVAPLLEAALAEAPDMPEAHLLWGRLAERRGDVPGAERSLRAALQLRPSYVAAAMALGNLLARQSRYAEAGEAFQAVLAAEPENSRARNNLANCYLALERFPEAIAEYRQVLRLRPNDAAVRENLEIAEAMLARSRPR